MAEDRGSKLDPSSQGEFQSIHDRLLTQRATERDAMRQEMVQAGGPLAYLQKLHPALVNLRLSGSKSSNSVDLPEAALLDETAAYFSACDERIQLCLTCPPDGAACKKHQVPCLKRGMKPRWDGDKLVAERCDPWRAYAMRARLMDAGVDQRSSRLSMADLERQNVVLGDEEIEKIDSFVTSACVSEDAWLVITAKAPVHTTLSVSILQNVLRRNHRIWARYEYAPTMQRRFKQYFRKDTEEIDPLDNLRECELAVIDGLAVKNVPDWYLFELRDLILDRWKRKANTIIASPAPIADLAGRYIQELSEAAHVVVE